MVEFITKYGLEILLALATAGALAFCRYLWKQFKTYKNMLEKQEDRKILKTVDASVEEKLEPIRNEIEELRAYIRNQQTIEQSHMTLILASYKFRLVQLCKEYLKRGYITTPEYEQLLEFYKVYSGLGGNGQAKEYYEKTIRLPVRDNVEE